MPKNSAASAFIKITIAAAAGLGTGIIAGIFLLTPEQKQVITDSQDLKAVKVLFIGNSLTYTNMLPVVLAEFIEKGMRKPTKVYQQCVPSETLAGHWQNGAAQRLIAAHDPWQYVVVQGASNEPIWNEEDLYKFADLFNTIIKNNKAKTILFETWADRGQSRAQKTISSVYENLGRRCGAPVIPVGQAFFYASNQDDKLNLYSGDGHHPGPDGTYLAACLFYCFLFGANPHGMPSKISFHDIDQKRDYPVINLEPAKAKELQDIAWRFYKETRNP